MKPKNLTELFNAFNKLNVLIIGDVMLDNYLWGKVERISPEAPVPIVSIQEKESRLGGAANVAINIRAMGANPILCSVIGNDVNGRSFIELMQQLDMSADGIFQSVDRKTTVKTRIIGNNHQMLRVDEEQEGEISVSERKQLLNRITNIISKKNIDVIIFEDYDKGIIGKTLIESINKIARQKGIPVAVDPKKKNFNFYKNVTLFKPNLKELREGMKIDLDKNHMEELSKAVHKLSDEHNIDTALITLSEKGVFFAHGKDDKLLPAHIRTIADVSGAGDTVISVAALCLALETDVELMATLANLAGGLVCEKIGVVPIEKQLLLEEAKRLKIK
ncbi:MAG: D-glycero-beta-D-manno-heptose-7-phosphate kinase [Bacteroidetes bacterium]|nr:D-glycero-beta-D-manno-heptose-7-phosphate kinase [Bacteroidota bacterium]